MKYDNKLAIALMNKWPNVIYSLSSSGYYFHFKFQTEECDECQWHWQWFQHLTLLGKIFAGSLTAPTMESAELRDGTLHAALESCIGRQTAETNQIMLILFRGGRKAKCSLWQKANWFMGNGVWGYFVRKAKVPIILISGSFINLIFAHNKDKVSQ